LFLFTINNMLCKALWCDLLGNLSEQLVIQLELGKARELQPKRLSLLSLPQQCPNSRKGFACHTRCDTGIVKG
jgi:hypothetical protein